MVIKNKLDDLSKYETEKYFEQITNIPENMSGVHSFLGWIHLQHTNKAVALHAGIYCCF